MQKNIQKTYLFLTDFWFFDIFFADKHTRIHLVRWIVKMMKLFVKISSSM